ncbi:hypothetical protein [Sorangium sp. So ce854]|uniref:hypothetical protein n=1 Tax=Sorangium sp. So ce854 TaxID=3133322 RepID=UPI003F638929
MLEVDTADFARSGASAIRGVTNLPDNTELVVSAEEPGDFGDSYSVSGTVRSGRFGGESASGDAAVPEGVYLIEVTMVSPGSQPEDVQSVIGESGERLTGKLVKKGNHGATVIARTKVLVGSKAVAEAASLKRATERRAALQRILAGLDRLERAGRAALHAFTPECMARMRVDHSSLKNIAGELSQMVLPLPGVFDLRYAASILQSCVSCADGFMDSCDDGRSKLRGAAAAIAAGKLR